MSTTTSSSSTPPEPAAGFDLDEIRVGVIAAGLSRLAAWGLEAPSLEEVLEAFEVSAERAAEAKAAVLELLPAHVPSREERQLALTHEVTGYLWAHPGTAEVSPRRRYYSHPFRRFVVELRGRYDDLEFEDFVDAVGVPKRTVAGWLRRGQRRARHHR
jgi:hypothetical protein